MHEPILTEAIKRARCKYLYRQWQRGHLSFESEVMDKAMRSLPVRRNELGGLLSDFIDYAHDHDLDPCDKCGRFCSTGDWCSTEAGLLCYGCQEDDNV